MKATPEDCACPLCKGSGFEFNNSSSNLRGTYFFLDDDGNTYRRQCSVCGGSGSVVYSEGKITPKDGPKIISFEKEALKVIQRALRNGFKNLQIPSSSTADPDDSGSSALPVFDGLVTDIPDADIMGDWDELSRIVKESIRESLKDLVPGTLSDLRPEPPPPVKINTAAIKDDILWLVRGAVRESMSGMKDDLIILIEQALRENMAGLSIPEPDLSGLEERILGPVKAAVEKAAGKRDEPAEDDTAKLAVSAISKLITRIKSIIDAPCVAEEISNADAPGQKKAPPSKSEATNNKKRKKKRWPSPMSVKVGDKFGNLVVIGAPRRTRLGKSQYHAVIASCRCSCGKVEDKDVYQMIYGKLLRCTECSQAGRRKPRKRKE